MNNSLRLFGPLAILLLNGVAAHAADPWKHFTKEDTPTLPGNEIQYVGVAQAGGVWIGTLAGATQAQAGVFKPFKNARGGVLDASIWTVLETATGPWIGTDEGALDCRGGKQQMTLAGYTVAPIVQVKPGVFWALGKSRNDTATLFEFTDGAWKAVDAVAKRRLTNLYRTANGHLWLTFDGNGVLQVDPATGIGKAVHHLESLNVTALLQDSRGVIWCGLWANGVACWDGNKWTRELPKTKESAILGIVEDGKASIWVATSANGLWHRPLNRSEWACELADQGAVNLLVATKDGRVWISGQNLSGLRYWNGTEWVVSLDSPLPLRALVEAADGTLWAGGVLDGVYMLKR